MPHGKSCKYGIRASTGKSRVKFQRTDIDSMPIVPANIDFVTETRSTTLESKKGRITVEHILSALYALTINNVLIKISQGRGAHFRRKR